jgi:hypothetical protein
MKFTNGILFASILSLTVACNSKPRVVEQVDQNITHPQNASPGEDLSMQVRKVVAGEVMQAEKYTYVQVTDEAGEQYWVAVPSQSIESGVTYYYKGGLLKRNFESKEFNRVFETLYLIAGLSNHPLGEESSALDQAFAKLQQAESPSENTQVDPIEGSISLADLFSNPKKFEGKTVVVQGKCVKVNNQIMGRNWIHIQDGSGENENLDLTVTTSSVVEIGSVVTIEGTIALNRDFGAGYRYNVIMEDARLR